MIKEAKSKSFLKKADCIIDVRSPTEFYKAHLPHAKNIPLFNDQEREQVGLCYKQEGAQSATDLGIRIVSEKMDLLIRAYQGAVEQYNTIFLYCWRGGMRSTSVAYLIKNFFQKEVTVLQGGYKAFRRSMLLQIEKKRDFSLLSGMTGSGKTAILSELYALGEQVLDLEALAKHKGSTYGKTAAEQPSQEQFENLIGYHLQQFHPEKRVWVEDESRMIGKCKIPDPLFLKMRQSPLFVIERPVEERMKILEQEYSHIPKKTLVDQTHLLKKRLGKERTDQAISLIEKNNYHAACSILLQYYDKGYTFHSTRSTQKRTTLSFSGLTTRQWARKLICRSIGKEEGIFFHG